MCSQNRGSKDREDNLGDLADLPVVAATEYLDWYAATTGGKRDEKAEVPKSKVVVLSGEKVHFLQTVIDNPDRPSSAYAKLAKMGVQKAIRIRKQLVDQGWIRETRLNASSRGGATILIEPTERAIELFKGKQDV